MAEEIALENGRISHFRGLVTLTLTLDRVILHTIVHQSPTSTYVPNFIEIKETFCGWTDRWTFQTHFIRSTQKSRPKTAESIEMPFGKLTRVGPRNHVGLSQPQGVTSRRCGLLQTSFGVWTLVLSLWHRTWNCDAE